MNRTAFPARTMLTALACLPLLCGLLVHSGCGGGGSAAPKAAPAAPAVTIAGTLTGTPAAPQFNQQPVQAASAAVTVNGAPATVARLQPGVVLQGKATRSATGITLQSADVMTELKGPISAINLSGATLTVLGTTVTVNALTLLQQEQADHTFTDLTFADFAVGDVVAVFGTRQAAGDILATRIEREAPGAGGESEARGVVSGLDTTAKTFSLGALLVTYGSATVTGTLADGIRVEVEGALSGTTLAATKVHVELHAEGSEVEASGALSGLDATAKTFSLLTFKVDYSGALVEGTLTEGATVEVEGAMSATDPTLLVAVKVEVRFPKMGNGASDQEAKGPITALGAADLTLTVNGTVYWTDAQTLLLDHDTATGFAQLVVGDRVQVRALSTRTNAAGQPYAARVERKNNGA